MDYTGRRGLSAKECEAILAAMTGRYGARDRAFFQLGRYTGYRVSELLSLKVKDVWDGEKICDRVVIKKGFIKGGKKSRTMPLHQNARDAIKLHLRTAKLDHPLFHDWPLFGRQGRPVPITRYQALSILHAATTAAGVKDERIGTHSLRKTFASAAYSAVGNDIARLARLLGHSNPANTLRYVEFEAGELERIVLNM